MCLPEQMFSAGSCIRSKMSEYEFSKSGQVEIQGKYALNLVSFNKSAVVFEVIGLSNPTVRIIDKRPEVKIMTAKMMRTGNIDKLKKYFNKPALIRLLPCEENTILVALERTRAKSFKHMLWVAVGIKGKIPYYSNYIKFQAAPLRKNTFSMFYLFKKS